MQDSTVSEALLRMRRTKRRDVTVMKNWLDGRKKRRSGSVSLCEGTGVLKGDEGRDREHEKGMDTPVAIPCIVSFVIRSTSYYPSAPLPSSTRSTDGSVPARLPAGCLSREYAISKPPVFAPATSSLSPSFLFPFESSRYSRSVEGREYTARGSIYQIALRFPRTSSTVHLTAVSLRFKGHQSSAFILSETLTESFKVLESPNRDFHCGFAAHAFPFRARRVNDREITNQLA